MKYRILDSRIDKEYDIITEDGGVVSVYHNGENWISTYYQSRLTDFPSEEYIWDALSDSKTYVFTWEIEPTKEEVIKDALEWLVFPRPDVWEIDNDLFLNFFSLKV